MVVCYDKDRQSRDLGPKFEKKLSFGKYRPSADRALIQRMYDQIRINKKTGNLPTYEYLEEMNATMSAQDQSVQFMQIALKYLPEAKEQLDKAGVELSFEMIEPFMEIFTKVMQEAYQLGREDAVRELNQR